MLDKVDIQETISLYHEGGSTRPGAQRVQREVPSGAVRASFRELYSGIVEACFDDTEQWEQETGISPSTKEPRHA